MTEKDPYLLAHEELCSERYKNIGIQLSQLLEGAKDIMIVCKKNADDIIGLTTDLSERTGFSKGFWKALSLLSTCLTGLATVIAIYYSLKKGG